VKKRNFSDKLDRAEGKHGKKMHNRDQMAETKVLQHDNRGMAATCGSFYEGQPIGDKTFVKPWIASDCGDGWKGDSNINLGI